MQEVRSCTDYAAESALDRAIATCQDFYTGFSYVQQLLWHFEVGLRLCKVSLGSSGRELTTIIPARSANWTRLLVIRGTLRSTGVSGAFLCAVITRLCGGNSDWALDCCTMQGMASIKVARESLLPVPFA
jgi:hypothetical protein